MDAAEYRTRNEFRTRALRVLKDLEGPDIDLREICMRLRQTAEIELMRLNMDRKSGEIKAKAV